MNDHDSDHALETPRASASSHLDVVLVGAWLACLAAAAYLSRTGLGVIVL